MKKHYRTENDCLNCGAILEDKFCPKCGQENLQIKESFGHMMNHAISDYFHFDHQFFHTLRPLFLKPGYLTTQYMAGKRAQYLHPVKMYIFISVVFFLLFFQQKNAMMKIEHKDMTTTELNKAIKAINANAYMPPDAKKDVIKDLYRDNGYAVVNNKVVRDTSKKARLVQEKALENPHIVNPTTKDTTYAMYMASQQKLSPDKRDGWFERFYNRKAFAINKQGLNMREVIGEGIAHNFPKMMFILLPAFAFILRVTFYRSKKFYVEHLIYAFHLHCFIFLFLSATIILKFIIPADWVGVLSWLEFGASLVIIWYIYKSLKVVYARSWWRTITKMIGMSLTYLLMFTICMMLLLSFTVFTAA